MVCAFTVADDAEVVVERTLSFKVSQLAQVIELATVKAQASLGNKTDLTTLALAKGVKEGIKSAKGGLKAGGGALFAAAPKGPAGTAGFVLSAFYVGYALGYKIDEAFGLSDKTSDWLVEVF
jgi:hypothetical protein